MAIRNTILLMVMVLLDKWIFLTTICVEKLKYLRGLVLTTGGSRDQLGAITTSTFDLDTPPGYTH